MNKKLLTVAIAGAMATPMAAQAMKYKLSGQVNRAIVFMDDGVQSDVRNVDSIASGTRIRLKGSEDLGNGMKVGFYWEMQTSSSASAYGGESFASQNFPDANSDGGNGAASGTDMRQANVWFSGNWGKLSMGQLDGAANGATESDLSGTGISGNSVLRRSYTGAIAWRTSAGATIGQTSGSTHNSLDAFSRYDGIRYDTPALGPVTVSASIGNDNKWEVAARVDTAIGGGQLSGALFYGENDQGSQVTGSSPNSGVDNIWGGSASFLFSQGTNISVSYAQRDIENNGPEGENWFVKLGHKWGPHAVGIGYGETDGVARTAAGDFQDTGWNIGYVHSLKKANTQMYASFIHQELDTPTGTPSVEDINAFVVGARVQFD